MIFDNANILPYYPSLDFQDYKKAYSYGQIVPVITGMAYAPPFQWIVDKGYTVTSFKIVNFNTGVENEVLSDAIDGGFETVTTNEDYDILKYPSTQIFGSFLPKEGLYYIKITNGVSELFSELFNMCRGEKTVKIEYWHNTDFAYNGGHFDYNNNYKHQIFTNADIAKPLYNFEERAVKRNGLNYSLQHISYKSYRFSMFVPEYLVDAMRFIRLHDNVRIIHNGVTFDVDEFNMAVEWSNVGQVAAVNCEFRTDTVVNISGRAII